MEHAELLRASHVLAVPDAMATGGRWMPRNLDGCLILGGGYLSDAALAAWQVPRCLGNSKIG